MVGANQLVPLEEEEEMQAQEQAQVIPHEAVVAVAAQAQGRQPRHNIDLRLFLLVGMPLLTCLFCSLFTQNKNGAV
jgi:4-amino-4-deoxy-L-arabinose transferase-like glycosyltransferase